MNREPPNWLRWLTSPWNVYRLKRRTIGQRGTIKAQRKQIMALRKAVDELRSELNEIHNDFTSADAIASRRQRNIIAAESSVKARLAELGEENDALADMVLLLRRENEALKLEASASRLERRQ
jgi:hypothetical protein